MAIIKYIGLIIMVLAFSGCTVLGFAADLALRSVFDEHRNSADPNFRNNNGNRTELIFTEQGLKHDVVVVKQLLKKLSDSNHDTTPIPQENVRPQPLVCNNVKDGKQQCYAPEYYKDMYIKENISHHKKINSAKN